MATLTVVKFPSVTGADAALDTLERLQKEQLINVIDAATVSWPAGRKKPKTRQLHHLAAGGALGGAFWGMLFGLIFLVPLFGLAIGAAAGALAGSMADVGIDDRFIKEVREKVTPGTSALFLMSSDAVLEKVSEAFKGTEMELVHTNLSSEDEARLKEVFAEED